MSAQGVTHFIANEADFTSLDQWEREYVFFHKILDIPFFKKFRMWKAFYQLRKRVIKKHTTSANKTLRTKLFNLDLVLTEPMVKIREMCMQIAQLRLFQDNSGQILSLEEFGRLQDQQRLRVIEKLGQIMKKLMEMVSDSCKKYMMKAGFGDKFKDLGEMQEPVANEFEANTHETKPEKHLKSNKPSFELTQEDPFQMSYTELSQKKAACKRLMNFIRLVDYLVLDSLALLVFRSLEAILTKLKILSSKIHEQENTNDIVHDDPDSVPLFKTEVLLHGEVLTVLPSKESIEKKVDQVIKSFFEAIKVDRLLSNKEFEEYLEPVLNDRGEEIKIGEGPNIRQIVTREEMYNDLLTNIYGALNVAFQQVEGYAASFEELRNMFTTNSRMSIHAIQESDPAIEFFRDEMIRYKTEKDFAEKMRMEKQLGIFFVDTTKLKEVFIPSPQKCMDALHELLPKIAKAKNDTLYETISAAVRKLQQTPTSLEGFVEYLHYVEKIAHSLEGIESQYRVLQDMYQLMEDEKVYVPSDDKENFFVRTVSTITTLRASVTLAEETREDKINKFGQDVERKFEDMRSEIKDINEKANDPMITDEASTKDMDKVITFLEGLKTSVEQVKKRSKQLAGYQEMFKLNVEEISDANMVQESIELKLKLWTSLRNWGELSRTWLVTKFKQLNGDNLSKTVDEYSLVVQQVEKGLNDQVITPILKTEVSHWQKMLPVIISLKNTALKKRHWVVLDELIGRPVDESFEVAALYELNVAAKEAQIREISQQASNEESLEELLRTVKEHWQKNEFEIVTHKEYYILGSIDDIKLQLEDDMITVSTILASNDVAAIKAQVLKYEEDLRTVFDTLDQWLKCQMKWLYLENVFSAPDIQVQLKDDAKMFTSVDRFFKDVMKRTNETKNVLASSLQSGLLEKFKMYNEHLDRIEKSLEQYLEKKRNRFARFYFLSNDDLLDILSQTKNPQAVQPHLEKFFDGIKSLVIEDNVNVKAMQSREGEKVQFVSTTMKARGNVEEWLGIVEGQMRDTLTQLTRQAVKDYVTMNDREKWILTHHCQIVLTVAQIFWARDITKCLESDNPKKELEKYVNICKQQLNKLAALTRTKLSKIERKTICTLIIIDVHGRDVIEQMIEEQVSAPTDFGWMKQLRYYWDVERNNCFVRQSNSEFKFGYEYLGCQSRLVITPLTDRVYMTLTGALHLNLGGAPAGPAGTGKTESVKDLAKALAIQCVVYNCSDGVTFEMMYKFFSGIVQTGAWACFDEFNRINVEVLSVIASQLQTIQDALKAKKLRFCLEEEKEIQLVGTCGVFITMNPGYAGRTELPDNLKALFRPVAVMTPDYGLISEVTLFSEGYEDAKTLSKKMVQLYKLSNEQLSAQHHYDFGMRAMKSVLVMAGELKRANPNQSEDITLMKAMKDSNIPKFVADDVGLFEGIVSDLFPNIKSEKQINEELQQAIKDKLQERGLDVLPAFVTKILQFYDTLIVRHGVMLVGPTCSGKTTNRSVLSDVIGELRQKGSQNKTFQVIRQYEMNPKSITYGELYGVFNLTTHEWYDGLIPHFTRKAVKDQTDDEKWLVFDGPVDTLWIESMNSVLDDSKLLCLDNTERIQINDKVHFIFEVQDLAVASPATVSRCGMVYMDPHDLGWMPFVNTWLKKSLPEPYKANEPHLRELFEDHVAAGLQFVRGTCKEDIPSVNMNLVSSLCDMMLAILTFHKFDPSTKKPEQVNTMLEMLFCFCYVWSIGGNIVTENKFMFDKFAREQLKKVCNMPPQGMVYDYCIDFESISFMNWEFKVQEYVYNPATPYFQIMVPTVDTVRFSYLLKALTCIEKPVLLNGKTGVGKTSIIANCFNNEKDIELVSIQFSAQTSAKRTQETIESKLILRKNVLRAPPGKKVILFIDDLNMPQLEQFFASPPIELLRQMIGSGGFYDVEDKANFPWKGIEDVTVVTACGPPGGGRNPITPRLVRMFNNLNTPDISEDSMSRIFTSILSGFFNNFTEEIRNIAKPIVRSAVELYNRVCEDFRPTPKCSHYTFNLRDLSKVFQGILLVEQENTRAAKVVAKLWIHESLRCFHDRFINETDRNKFKDIILELCKRNLKSVQVTDDDLYGANPIVFGDFMNMTNAERKYEQVASVNAIAQKFDSYLDIYNSKSASKMDLVFFPDATLHTARIVRIIRQQRGNALLVGVGGSGKQSLTRLAASIAGYEIYEIKLKRGYSIDDFREDLRALYKIAGVAQTPVVFLLSDSQIVNEGFLEDINNILNSGEVPNLFEPEDREKIINELRPKAKEAGIGESRDAIYAYFINCVRDNLHIVLCMSPVGDAFRNRTRKFPSLVNCCTIDWFDEWPKDALKAVAERKFVKIDINDDEIKNVLTSMCVTVHSSAADTADRYYNEVRRKYYITPASYLEFITFYDSLLQKKRNDLNTSRDKFMKGLKILKMTNEDVQQMKRDIEELQPVLNQTKIETDAILVDVQTKTAAANEKRQTVSAEEKVITEKTQKADEMAKQAKEELAIALPALSKATKALDMIDKGDIAEIKKYKQVGDPIKLVMQAVLILFGEKKTDWDQAVKTLGDPKFVPICINYDKDNIPPATIAKLKKIMADPNFDEEVVGRSSGACKSLCIWARAIVNYSETYKKVEPLQESLAKANEELSKMQSELKVKRDALNLVESEIKDLNTKYEDSVHKKKTTEDRIEISKIRLTRAEKLTTSLADEYNRWTKSVERLDKEIINAPGDIFIAAACIVYYGAFSAVYRRELVAQWANSFKECNIPVSDDLELENIVSNPVLIREWGIAGLPTDSHSKQNACIVTQANRWPLLIDPQGQANNWIKQMEKMNGLKVCRLSDSNYLRVLDTAIRIGTPVLVEDLQETIDPALEPLLQKQVYKNKGKTVIRLGAQEVDYNMKFKFYMTTKLSNPHYLPEICNKVTLINFTVTSKGLEDQLLGDVVRKLEKEMEEQKDKLVLSTAEDKKMLADLEDQILQSLSAVKEGENILDNEQIIKTLDNAKYMANVIVERVVKAEQTEKDLNLAREKYRSVAIRGSILYFVMADLAKVDPMYQYSLEYFKKLFNMCIDNTPTVVSKEALLTNLITNITTTVFGNVCRGLFEKDKLIFSFSICIQVLKNLEMVRDEDWNLFVRGIGIEKAAKPKPEKLLWLSNKTWDILSVMEQRVPAMKGITESVFNNSEPWQSYSENSQLYEQKLPDSWSNKLSPFQHLLVVKAFREEKLLYASIHFVRTQLDPSFTEYPPLDLSKAIADTTSSTPIVFVLSQGADPTELLKRFAQNAGYENRLYIKSLGQGQEGQARKLIEKGRKNGDWILLQNCHLMVSFLPELETIITNFSSPTAVLHPEFRLWLTSMPSPSFPIPILQNSVKLTNEPPKGLRANVLRTYKDMPEEYFESFELNEKFPECSKQLAFKKLLFGLSVFHAVIQERKKFGPLGWTIQYEFNDSDLGVAKMWLQIFLKEQALLPWDSLKYVIGEIVYGGRVTDPWDRRCILQILRQYITTDILNEKYQYSASKIYKIPHGGNLNTFRSYIETLPYTDDPELFSMHENANVVFQLQETNHMLGTIMSMQPRSSSAGSSQGDNAAKELAQQLLDQLPPNLDKEEAGHSTFTYGLNGTMNSLSVVLSHEMLRFNKLLDVIRSTLRELLKAIDGLVVLSAELEKMLQSMLSNDVPELWSKAAYPSMKPLASWVTDLHARVAFLRDWLKHGPPKCFWISGFFFPQGFLTGVLQTFARKTEIAIDRLSFGFKVQDVFDPSEITHVPEDGVLVHGLFVDAGKWDSKGKCIREPDLGKNTYRLPIIHFLPEPDHKVKSTVYECPLYKTSVRKGTLSSLGQSTNFIIAVELPIPLEKKPAYFTLQGTAALCENV